jgi:hypothetical protein
LIGLPKSKQRAAVAIAAGTVPLRVAFLPFEVLDLFSKIEPDHSVNVSVANAERKSWNAPTDFALWASKRFRVSLTSPQLEVY